MVQAGPLRPTCDTFLSPSVALSQLLRKRHIGNDIVTIIFQEPGALPFTPKNIRSHFQHVFIIVRVHNPCTDNVCYRYASPHPVPSSAQREGQAAGPSGSQYRPPTTSHAVLQEESTAHTPHTISERGFLPERGMAPQFC